MLGLIHGIIGTVGAVGSGADLEMTDPNMVAGQPYNITSLKIQIPSSWSY
jgi:hypothetical protein